MEHFSASNETEISAVVAEAAAKARKLRIKSGGTRTVIGNAVTAETVLDTSANSGIVTYEPGSLHMVVRAGTPMADIENALDAEGQMLAFEPINHCALLGSNGNPTIGGVVAGNISGPRRFLAGACRDHVLGVRFVNGEGDVVKSGGRVMKNVTGLDLAKLQCGAWGTLGVLTEISLKTLPRPETALTLTIEDVDPAQAVAIFSKALGSPYEVSGAAWRESAACLRLEGFKVQVSSRSEKLSELLGVDIAGQVKGRAHDTLWTDLRDAKHFSGTDGDVWRVSVKPTDAPVILSQLEELLDFSCSLDWGGGLIWLQVNNAARDASGQIREVVAKHGGHAALIRGEDNRRKEIAVFQPETRRLADISAQLRRQFDPAGIFNPGIMGPGITGAES